MVTFRPSIHIKKFSFIALMAGQKRKKEKRKRKRTDGRLAVFAVSCTGAVVLMDSGLKRDDLIFV